VPRAFNLTLLLISGFLWSVNYYILTLQTHDYIDELDYTPLSAGLLIAMTPLGGIISSFYVSYWTNNSFKVPLVF
jgi:hypothetical protein